MAVASAAQVEWAAFGALAGSVEVVADREIVDENGSGVG